MLYFYLFLIVFFSLIGLFFGLRSIIILLTFFSKAPYVPLGGFLIRESVKCLDIKENDRFLDVGSGDGRVVFYAANNYSLGKTFSGVELNHVLFLFSKLRSFFHRDKDRIEFFRKNALKFDFRGFNKVYMYLLPEFIDELMPIFEKQLPKNSVVVSSLFPISKVFERSGNIEVKEITIRGKIKNIYLWKKK